MCRIMRARQPPRRNAVKLRGGGAAGAARGVLVGTAGVAAAPNAAAKERADPFSNRFPIMKYVVARSF